MFDCSCVSLFLRSFVRSFVCLCVRFFASWYGVCCVYSSLWCSFFVVGSVVVVVVVVVVVSRASVCKQVGPDLEFFIQDRAASSHM